MTQFYSWTGSLLFFIFSYVGTAAQDSTISLSKFEEFSTGKGKLLKLEIVSIANMGTLNSEFVSATDLNSKERKAALRFSHGWGLTNHVVEKNAIYIDLEDIPLLMAALDTMKNQLAADNLTPQRSFSIITSNDVRLSLRHEEGLLTAGRGIYISQLFRHLRSDVPWKTMKINTRYIDQLAEVLRKALSM